MSVPLICLKMHPCNVFFEGMVIKTTFIS